MPVATESVDWVISNCVVNLSPDKEKVFQEVYRVLKPGGRLLISDIVAENLSEQMKADMAAWAGCVAGAVSEKDYFDLFGEAGFENVAVVDKMDHKESSDLDSPRISSIRVAASKPRNI